MKVNEFREMSKINEKGEFTANGQLIEYKKNITYAEKVNIVYSVLENSFDAESNIYNRISIDSILKYLILTKYITNINFPKKKTDEGTIDNVEEIVDICFSSGIYQELIKNIKNDYEHILFLLDGKIEEQKEENHFTNILGKIVKQIQDLDEGKLEEMAKKASKLDVFRKQE